MTDDRQPPNYRDEKCGYGAPSASPDVVGSLFGIRGFVLTDDGYLRGVTYAVPWGPDWNQAQCLVARRPAEQVEPIPRLHPFWGRIHSVESGCMFPLEPGQPVEYQEGWQPDPCKGLDPLCGCGFYGYYDATTGRTSGYGNIRGVIEATGRSVVGPKGFRAPRARIVALVRPQTFTVRLSGIKQREVVALQATVALLIATHKELRMRPWFGGANKFGVLWGGCVAGLVLLGVGASDRTALLGAVSVVGTIVAALTYGSRRRTKRTAAHLVAMIRDGKKQIADFTADVDLDELMTLVAEHYPDAKVYPSMVAMLADYPPSDVRGLLGIEFPEGDE